MQSKKFLDDGRNTVGLSLALPCPFLPGISTFGDRAQGFRGQQPRMLKVDFRIGTQGVFPCHAAMAIADRPGLGAARLHDQVQTGHMSVGDLVALGARLNGLDGAGVKNLRQDLVLLG
jgi:hypothetical protein